MRYSAVGTASEVGSFPEDFAASVQADEVITAQQSGDIDDRLRSVELTAQAMKTLQPVR